MKKDVLMKMFLVSLPILAIALATTENSVTVFDSVAKTTTYYSFFQLIPDVSTQILTPLAGILCVVSGLLAAGYLLLSKAWLLQGGFWTAFLSAMAGIAPVLFRGDVLVVPNVMFGILMLVDCVMLYIMKKKPGKEEKHNQGTRLELH